MAEKLPPKEAQVVIIGGGVSGCSVAYHLAKLGWSDIVLLERKQLTSGTTWHAAGLIGQMRASHNLTRLAKYSSALYKDLEAETGIATGFRQCGSMTIALSEDRKQELLRQASMASAFDVEVNMIDPHEVKRLYPHLSQKNMTAAAFIPKDGQGDPANITQALAKGARMGGVKIFEMTKVEDVMIDIPSANNQAPDIQNKKRVQGVKWRNEAGDEGVIKTDKIVNAGGMWAASLGAKSGVSIPLHACEHFYIVTEAIDGLGHLPVLRVPDECSYYKEDAGKMLVGAFEPVAKPWGMEGINEDFCFDQLPEDIDHFGPILDQAIERMPMLAEAGIHTFFNGPESFTPDDRFYLGEAPFIQGYFVAAGYNSIGIASSGGAGKALAEWMDGGAPPFDLWDVDIRRAQPFQRNRLYLHDRVRETLGLLYADHYPYRQMTSSRGVRRSPIHHLLKENGAVFGEVAGYERANWFANDGQKAEYDYDWAGQNWFDNHRIDHMAVRQNIGMFDMSSFGKIMVAGPDAMRFLNRVCANQMDVAVGKIIYTQMLNDKGGIESDLTVTRLAMDEFLLVVPVASLIRDLDWLWRQKQDESSLVIKDISASEAVILLMGPNVRALLADLSKDDFSNEAQPFGTAREVELAMGIARAHRVSYVGELGYEFYIASDQAAHICEAILQAGKAHDLKLCGLHALDSCRIEKAFRHFGHDITDEDHLLEAGLGFAARLNKGDFIGRESLLQKKEDGLSKMMLQFQLTDPSQFLFHHEPIWMNGKPVSFTTSANYGHYLGAAIAMGYVPLTDGMTINDLESQHYEIEIAGKRHTAKASLKPLYDPTSAKVKG